ncbi:RecA/RadA recombinase [Spinactinospora alkalitolerans]|uniref:RecA/RadA recombinase n=1 Tax=Spinactinospora alkalitolerans TaxID=687207 RepID=A0A852U0V4_9ACTN|nr:type IV secretion system DNA-binding domain-containing protein [Spinactinospora alkalitolerans]NYE50476.1 RecA/RadA recombinase [Spinactinospora alkalitolerans]
MTTAEPRPEPNPAPGAEPEPPEDTPPPAPEPEPEPEPGPTPDPQPGPPPPDNPADPGDPPATDQEAPEEPLLECGVMEVSCHISNWFHDLVESALNPLFGWLGAMAFRTPTPTDGMEGLWSGTLTTANALYVLLVVVGGVVVMSHETVQARYAAKEVLPRLAAGFIASNASLWIATEMIRAANAVSTAVSSDGIDAEEAAANLRERMEWLLMEGVLFILLLVVAAVVLLVVWCAVEVVRIAMAIVLVTAAPLLLAPQTNRIAALWWRYMAALLAVPIGQAIAFIAFMRLFFEGRFQYFGSWESAALTPGPAVQGTVVLGSQVVELAAHDPGGEGGVLLNIMLLLTMLYVQIRIPFWAMKIAAGSGSDSSPLMRLARTAMMVLIFRRAVPGLRGRAAATAQALAATARAAPQGQRTGGWLRLARGDEYPLRTRFTDDPLRGLLGAVGDLDPDQRVCVRVCARPATGRRTARARTAAARLKRTHSATLAGLLLDPLGPGAKNVAGAPWPDAGDNIRAILTKAAAPRLACAISYQLTTTATGPAAAARLQGRAHGIAGAFAAFTSGTNHLRRRPMWQPALWADRRHLARGSLLSVPELAAIAHLPTDTAVAGLERAVALGVAESRQHTHIIGKTGSGKSTLLANLVLQDAEAGRAAVVIDPRGDLITDILTRLPAPAADRTILFDPDDRTRPPRLNLLQGEDPEFTSDTVTGIFHRIYERSWGPRTDDILRATTLTLTRAGDPALTLAHIPRLLADDAFRTGLVDAVRDPALAGFWDWYNQLTPGARSTVTGPILNKVRTALLRPWVRNVLASGPSTIDLTRAFDEGGLVLLRLPKGLLGEDTAALIGSFALAATWQTVTARVHQSEHRRKDVAAYIDECHNFLNMPGSLADMLVEARGYRLALALAHQELGQLPTELRKAVSANARSKVYFSCSPDDAAQLEQHTLPNLGSYDLMHLSDYQAAGRLLVGARERPAFTMRTRPMPAPVPGRATAVRAAARRHSPPGGGTVPARIDKRFEDTEENSA